MIINEIRAELAKLLKPNPEILKPESEADIIIVNVLKKDTAFIYAHGDQEINPAATKKLIKMAEKRALGHPLAYLNGHKEFYGLFFYVNKNVLVPRPETEIMVELALKKIHNRNEAATFVDIGTGSGCIIISIAKNIDNKNCQFFGLDISEKALETARKNANFHGLDNRIKFLRSNILNGFNKHIVKNNKIIIMANLPYLTSEQIKESPTIRFEPIIALRAKEQGLYYYRMLFEQTKKKFIGHEICIYCEFDHSQTKNICSLAKSILPDYKINIHKDLGGYDRILILEKKTVQNICTVF
jgi:release factor glutamine methyltransferase